MTDRYKILLTWELGGGLGHLARLRPLALNLSAAGHSVTMALRHSPHTNTLPRSLTIVPVPVSPKSCQAIAQPVSIADILHNEGAATATHLGALVRAWRGLFKLLRPDVIVMDYSPVALLASQGLGMARVSLGTGFASPPAVSPLPNLRAWQDHYPDRIQATENAVLQAFNSQLEAQEQPPLGCLGELFDRVDANLLTTFPELDHYPDRTNGQYVGTWTDFAGPIPEWPDGDGPRVFVYLKPFRGLPRLLDHLASRAISGMIYLGGSIHTKRWRGSTLRFSNQPIDMEAAAGWCDAAVLHAGHGSTAAMLLAGKPILQLPSHVEQYHNGLATERLEAGRMAMLDRPDDIHAAIDALLDSGEGRAGARRFAERYADHDPDRALSRVVERIIDLAEQRA